MPVYTSNLSAVSDPLTDLADYLSSITNLDPRVWIGLKSLQILTCDNLGEVPILDAFPHRGLDELGCGVEDVQVLT